jgi:hypothetical protein
VIFLNACKLVEDDVYDKGEIGEDECFFLFVYG